jgi:hypothetical protein
MRTTVESHLLMQAQIWKGEARCANHTIGQIYQAVTGAKGEPGNWNGAEPVKALVAERDALRAENRRLRSEVSRSSYHCD